MFLSAGFGCSNRRRMTDLTVDSEFFHQVHKPLHRPSRFDPYAHRTWKRGIKLPHAVAFVRESLVHNFSRRGVQHRQRLLASMQVTSYNPHLGLLRSEHCWGEHRTVYSDRREAGAVMASIRTWTRESRYHVPVSSPVPETAPNIEPVPSLRSLSGMLAIASVFAILGGFLDAYAYLAR